MIFLSFFKKRGPQRIGVQSGYDLWSDHYSDEKNPIKAASDQAVKEMLPDLAAKSILDAGCGTGYFCHYAELAGAKKITGVDFSEGMISQARRHCTRTQFILGEIQNVSLTARADIIICALVLGHLKDLGQVLATLANNLNDDGHLLITDFHPSLSAKGQKRTFQANNKNFEIPHYIHRIEEYQVLLQELGLVLEDKKDTVWNNLPAVFALKARKKAS